MKRLGFVSDAGYRFERGVDFDGCTRAVERAVRRRAESSRPPFKYPAAVTSSSSK